MAIERKFIEESMKKVKIDRYIKDELKKIGVGDVQVKRTPLGTRITIEAVRPGLVIGKKGKNIQMLTDTIKEKYKVENPQLEVADIAEAEFNPGIMAKQLAQTLEAQVHFRRACHNMLNQIMRRGALGVMIIVTGKISGARARSEKFKAGYIRYCGEPSLIYMKEATTQANLKPGIVGIKIRIMPPIQKNIDALELKDVALPEQPESVKNAEAKPAEIKKLQPQKKAQRKKAAKEPEAKKQEEKPQPPAETKPAETGTIEVQ